MHIEIKSDTLTNVRPYKDRQYGDQQAALFLDGADYPLPFRINRQVGEALKPGRYGFASGSFQTDQHGNLKIGRASFVPLAPALAKAS